MKNIHIWPKGKFNKNIWKINQVFSFQSFEERKKEKKKKLQHPNTLKVINVKVVSHSVSISVHNVRSNRTNWKNKKEK